MKYLSTRSLFFLFITFRLMSLLLYRPGGLLEVGEPYLGLFMLDALGGQGVPVLGGLPQGMPVQVVGGALLLPFEIGTLWLLLELLRRDNSEEEARRRALLWAASPLPLWAWLTGGVPIVTFLLLAAYWLTGLKRRSWLWAALPLAFATLIEGPRAELTVLLLPFILLLVPQATTRSALFTLGALLAGPVSRLLGVTGTAATAFQMGYILTLAPILTEWLLMLNIASPLHSLAFWEPWRKRIFATVALSSLLLFTSALFILAPRELRPARLAASPLAPALSQMESAPEGWFITDSHELWQESVSLGVGELIPYVVSPNNLEPLRSELLAAPAPLWVLQSQSDKAPLVLDPLLADFFPASKQLLDDGTRLRPFVSGLNAPLTPVNGAFVDGVSLTQARLPATIQPGSLLPVELHWEWEESAGKQKLFLHFIAPDGTLASQRDTLPSLTPNRHALIVPATLPPGTYTLLAGRYDPETGERVALMQGGDTIVLGEVKIEQGWGEK
jgi:hypothetical protein